MADYMVVASGTSSRQVAAMAEHIEFKLKQNKIAILGLEGLRQADWVLTTRTMSLCICSGLKCVNFTALNVCGPMMQSKKSSLSVPTGSRNQTIITPRTLIMQLFIVAVGKARGSAEHSLPKTGWGGFPRVAYP